MSKFYSGKMKHCLVIFTFYSLGVQSYFASYKSSIFRSPNFIKRSAVELTTESQSDSEVPEAVEEQMPLEGQRRVKWTASAKGSVRVKEQSRTVEEYLALPASQYSVLSAEQITRLSDTEFKCTLGTMNFFGTKITPVLFVDVDVYPNDAKSIISVTRAETVGSEIAEKINGTFSISAINTVTAGRDEKNRSILSSETNLLIDVVTPPGSKLPYRVVESGGNFIIQSTLSVIIQAFVRILAADFKRWSAGCDARDAVTSEKLY